MVGRAAFFNGLLRKQTELQTAISRLLPQNTILQHLLTNSSTPSLTSVSLSSIMQEWLCPLAGFESKRVCREEDGLLLSSSGKNERHDQSISLSSIRIARVVLDNSIRLFISGAVRVNDGGGVEKNESGEFFDWNRFSEGVIVAFHPHCAFDQYCGEIQVENECQCSSKNSKIFGQSHHNHNNDNLNIEKHFIAEIQIHKSSVHVETMLASGRKLSLFWSPSIPRRATMDSAKNTTNHHQHALSNPSVYYLGEGIIEQGEEIIPLPTHSRLPWKQLSPSSRITARLERRLEETEQFIHTNREVSCLESSSIPGCRHLVHRLYHSVLEELMKWKMELLVSILFSNGDVDG